MVWPFKNNKNWEKWINTGESPFAYDKQEEELIFDSLFDLLVFLHQFQYTPVAPASYKNGKFRMYISKADLEDIGVMALSSPPRPREECAKDYELLSELCRALMHTGLSNIVLNNSSCLNINPSFYWSSYSEHLFYTPKYKSPILVEDDYGVFKYSFKYIKMICDLNRDPIELKTMHSSKILESLKNEQS